MKVFCPSDPAFYLLLQGPEGKIIPPIEDSSIELVGVAVPCSGDNDDFSQSSVYGTAN
jgi:hypothetical protein